MRIAGAALSLSSWLAATAASSSFLSFFFGLALAAANKADAAAYYSALGALETLVEGTSYGSLLSAGVGAEAAPASFLYESWKNSSAASHGASEGSPNAATEVGKKGDPPHLHAASAAPGPPSNKPSGIPMRLSELEELAGVVKIFVNSVKADFVSPWQVTAQTEHTGSGFAIEGQMIMTNAHLVADQTRVLVRKHGSPKRYLARVLAVCHECDLALVTVDEESFWTGVKPLVFGEIPQLRETVAVLGYPTGGDQLSITEGVVSRVGVSQYAHSSLGLLTVQIDAAINPGNSGGPAVARGRVVGVAFQGFSQMQNLGYIVPYPVIRHFLNDVAMHRRHTGFVSLGIKAQTMENEALKRSKGVHMIPAEALPPNVTAEGVLVMAVDQLRLRLYREGQIVLPVSRYGPLKGEKHAQCAAKEGKQQPAAAPCAADADTRTTQLLVDLPAGASGDALASQRDVREGKARVVWEPEGWAAGGPFEGPPSRAPLQPFVSTVRLHGPGLAPAPPAPLSHLEKKPAIEQRLPAPSAPLVESEGKHQATDEAAATSSTGGPSDGQRAAPGGAQIPETSARPLKETEGAAATEQQEKGRGKESREEGGPRQAEGEQEQQRSAGPPQRGPSGESARMTGEEKQGGNNASDKQVYLGSLLRMLLKKPAAEAANSKEDKKSYAEVPEDEEKENERDDEQKKEKPASPQLAANPEEGGGGTPDDNEVGKEPASLVSPNKRMQAAPALSEEGRIRFEVEVIKVEAASRRTEPAAEAQQRTEKEGQVELQKGKQEAEPSKTAASEALSAGTQTDHDALAPAALTLAANPYFDPEVVKDEQFFGLREGDVLLSIGNYNIADDGTVSFRDLERVALTYVVTHFFNGQTTFAYVLREGRILKVTIPLMAPNLKIPPFSWDTKPSYFVFGGFVFTPLTKVLLQAKLHKEAPFVFEHLVSRLDFQEKEGDQFVVLSLILASDVSVGYEHPPCMVESVNGEEVRNMRDLVRLIENTSGEFVKLRLALGGSNYLLVVIDKQKAQAIQQKVLREHNIVRDRSPDLL